MAKRRRDEVTKRRSGEEATGREGIRGLSGARDRAGHRSRGEGRRGGAQRLVGPSRPWMTFSLSKNMKTMCFISIWRGAGRQWRNAAVQRVCTCTCTMQPRPCPRPRPALALTLDLALAWRIVAPLAPRIKPTQFSRSGTSKNSVSSRRSRSEYTTVGPSPPLRCCSVIWMHSRARSTASGLPISSTLGRAGARVRVRVRVRVRMRVRRGSGVKVR